MLIKNSLISGTQVTDDSNCLSHEEVAKFKRFNGCGAKLLAEEYAKSATEHERDP